MSTSKSSKARAPQTLVFSHANSFAAGTYRVLFEALRARGFAVSAIDKFGHDPRYPVSSNWPLLVQQLLDFTQQQVAQAGAPVWLVGHSLGGFLSLMAACQAPALARGVLLLDAPMLGGWKARALGLAKHAQVVGSLSPGSVSKRRRNQWPDRASALSYFQGKRAFARWNAQVLQDYVTSGTREVSVDGKKHCELTFDRAIETVIYNTLPHNFDALLKQHPLQCPVSFIGGTHSAENRQVGLAMTQRITQGRVMMLDGTHLFPMEKPFASAAAIEAALLNLCA